MTEMISVSRVICDFLVLVICALPMLIFHEFVKPYKRGFYCDDESIRYPFQPSTVTRHMLIVIGLGTAVLLIIGTEIFRALAWEKSCATQFKRYTCGSRSVHRLLVRLYVFLGYFCLGVCFNQLMVDVAKYTIGRHRPHFMDVCKPDIGYTNCASDHKYIVNFKCTGNDSRMIHESMLSFYSGHASFSFYVAWYISLYLHARLYKPLLSRIVVPAIQFALFFGAAFVAYSRVSDYKHHWSDVLVGTFFGSTIGIIVAVCIAEVFKRREIPPAHDSSCSFGLIPLDSRTVVTVEEGVGVGVPIASNKPVITARSIVLNNSGDGAHSEQARGPSFIPAGQNAAGNEKALPVTYHAPPHRSGIFLDPVLVLPVNVSDDDEDPAYPQAHGRGQTYRIPSPGSGSRHIR